MMGCKILPATIAAAALLLLPGSPRAEDNARGVGEVPRADNNARGVGEVPRAEDNARGVGGAARADNNAAGYSLRPPPLSVPSGAPGAVRRSVMQFYDWTLICDTVLADKKQVCNVSQALWDSQNSMVFSWSLAASDKGEPFMLLRTAPDTDIKTPLRLALSGVSKVISLDFVGCNEALCMAQTPVGPVLTRAIGNESDAAISYRTAAKGMLQFSVPLRGLKAAVAAIK